MISIRKETRPGRTPAASMDAQSWPGTGNYHLEGFEDANASTRLSFSRGPAVALRNHIRIDYDYLVVLLARMRIHC